MPYHLTLCQLHQLRAALDAIHDPHILRALIEHIEYRHNAIDMHRDHFPVCPHMDAHAQALIASSWDCLSGLARRQVDEAPTPQLSAAT